MLQMSPQNYKAVKVIHILLISIWIGTGICLLFLLSLINRENALVLIKSIHLMDLLIIIPANLLTLITGIIFSIKSKWGFKRHKWILLKYLINLIPFVLGGVLFAPNVLNMISILEKQGGSGINDSSFILSKLVFTSLVGFQTLILLIAVILSVYKPKFSKEIKE